MAVIREKANSRGSNSKATKVVLECEKLGLTKEFDVDHAERLLLMRNNGGWHLPTDSNFEFDKENGIRYRRDNQKNSGAKE
jgi:hypothetical protein